MEDIPLETWDRAPTVVGKRIARTSGREEFRSGIEGKSKVFADSRSNPAFDVRRSRRGWSRYDISGKVRLIEQMELLLPCRSSRTLSAKGDGSATTAAIMSSCFIEGDQCGEKDLGNADRSGEDPSRFSLRSSKGSPIYGRMVPQNRWKDRS